MDQTVINRVISAYASRPTRPSHAVMIDQGDAVLLLFEDGTASITNAVAVVRSLTDEQVVNSADPVSGLGS